MRPKVKGLSPRETGDSGQLVASWFKTSLLKLSGCCSNDLFFLNGNLGESTESAGKVSFFSYTISPSLSSVLGY
jgi:hypothetical protein